MKVKAIIFLKDRNVKSIILNRKNRQDNKFSYKNETYLVIRDYSVMTFRRILFVFKKHYLTYYYREGIPDPLPTPLFNDLEYQGVTAEELNSIFTPYLYRIVAGKASSLRSDIQFYVICGIGLASLYSLWLIHKIGKFLGAL